MQGKLVYIQSDKYLSVLASITRVSAGLQVKGHNLT